MLWDRVFKVCGTYHCPVAMETFDIEVYALHSEGIIFFQLHFKKLHPCFLSILQVTHYQIIMAQTL